MIKLAGIQMDVEAGHKARNLAHAQELIAEAARHGADLIVVPEVMDLGWTDPSARQQASAIPSGDTCTRLSAAARQHGVYLCAGLVERAPDGTIYNAAVILDRLGVCHTELGTLGLLICADAFAQDHVISRTLGYMGADLIVSPSSWAVPPDHDNTATPYGDEWRAAYSPVARDFALWFVGVSNVGPIPAGPWAGWRGIGCSLVVGPDGQPVVQGPYSEETILYVEIDPVARPARGTQWAARGRP